MLYSRNFDEKKLVLCALDAESVTETLLKAEHYIQYWLFSSATKSAPVRAVLYLETLIAYYRNSRVILDNRIPEYEYYLKRLTDENIEVIDLNAFLDAKNAQPRNCASKALHIDPSGNLFPCSKALKHTLICNVQDIERMNKIRTYLAPQCSCKHGFLVFNQDDLMSVKKISVEFGGACQAQCIYCYQSEKEYGCVPDSGFPYAALETFLNEISPDELFVAGGEVLVQKNTLDFLRQFKQNRPDTEITVKTNASTDNWKIASELFQNVIVTLNGFSQTTVQAIMGKSIDIGRVKIFCENIGKTKTKLFLKYLLSPLNIAEAPEFLSWAAGAGAEEIAFSKAMVFGKDKNGSWSGSSFNENNDAYWEKILQRIGNEMNCVIRENCDRLPQIRFEQHSEKLMHIDSLSFQKE